jgi:RNA polymerase sigma-70 factor (ECF subfamily)
MNPISFRNDVMTLKDRLFRLALRITLSKEDAEDVVQDTLVRIWRSMNEGVQIDNVEAFAMTICRNLALDHQARHEQRNIRFDAQLHDRPTNDRSPEEQLETADRMARLRAVVDELPEKQRTAFQLRDIDGRTYREIADVMGITESDVKVNIFRARKYIKNALTTLNDQEHEAEMR